jgi:hypothetical protein
LHKLDFAVVCERPPASLRSALPLYEGESNPLKINAHSPPAKGESRAKRGRGSLTHRVEIEITQSSPFSYFVFSPARPSMMIVPNPSRKRWL